MGLSHRWYLVTLCAQLHLAFGGHTWHPVTLGTRPFMAFCHTLHSVTVSTWLYFLTRLYLVLCHIWHSVTLSNWLHLALGRTWHLVTHGTRSLWTQSTKHLVTLGTLLHLALGHMALTTLDTQSLGTHSTWHPLRLVLSRTWYLVTLGTWSHLALGHTWNAVILGTGSTWRLVILGSRSIWH